jgi:hypothetical protein
LTVLKEYLQQHEEFLRYYLHYLRIALEIQRLPSLPDIGIIYVTFVVKCLTFVQIELRAVPPLKNSNLVSVCSHVASMLEDMLDGMCIIVSVNKYWISSEIRHVARACWSGLTRQQQVPIH